MVSAQNAPNLILQVRTRIPAGLPPRDILAGRIVEVFRMVIDRSKLYIPDRDIELGVTLTDDNDIRVINKAHRQTDAPTDVLSFPMFSDGLVKNANETAGDSPVALGDIVISLETLTCQASDRALPVHERFAECLVHGMLHIMGFEHSSESGRIDIEALEDDLVPHASGILAP